MISIRFYDHLIILHISRGQDFPYGCVYNLNLTYIQNRTANTDRTQISQLGLAIRWTKIIAIIYGVINDIYGTIGHRVMMRGRLFQGTVKLNFRFLSLIRILGHILRLAMPCFNLETSRNLKIFRPSTSLSSSYQGEPNISLPISSVL